LGPRWNFKFLGVFWRFHPNISFKSIYETNPEISPKTKYGGKNPEISPETKQKGKNPEVSPEQYIGEKTWDQS